MIAIDIRMPDTCQTCPFMAQAGYNRTKCAAAELKGMTGILPPGLEGRPEWCPITEIKSEK